MKLAIDDTDTADGNICVVTGAKDHYVKVSAVCCYVKCSASHVTTTSVASDDDDS